MAGRSCSGVIASRAAPSVICGAESNYAFPSSNCSGELVITEWIVYSGAVFGLEWLVDETNLT